MLKTFEDIVTSIIELNKLTNMGVPNGIHILLENWNELNDLNKLFIYSMLERYKMSFRYVDNLIIVEPSEPSKFVF